MPQQTKIFRVFVSSTFTDMKEERNILQKTVFPKLEKFCEEKGAKFQAVDLRWGVNEESQLNQKTLEICLNEIARCQRISPKPNFLLLLGNKYGWQPIPTKIPEVEMNVIQNAIDSKQKALIDKWYMKDDNAIPPEYVLQPRTDDCEQYEVWEKIEVVIRKTLRNAVDKVSFNSEQRIKYFTSATHQEIVSGALNSGEVMEKPEEHVIAMIRETKGLPFDNSPRGFIDLINEQPDLYSKTQLEDLKGQLKIKLGNNFIPYQAKWKDGKTVMNDPSYFEHTIYDFLEVIINEQLKEVISSEEIDHEITLHAEFKTKLTEHFCGRDDILMTLKTYLNDSTEKRVMAMIGDSGSGKSSVMAKAIQEAENNFKNAVLVYRFIGTTSRSSNIISLLQSVCVQIARKFGTTLEMYVGEGTEKAMYDLNELAEVLKKCLNLGTSEKPILLFLDALDQLTDSDNAKSLHWLPRELPEHARLLVSALPELEANLSSNIREKLPVLPKTDAVQIMKRWLDAISRKLTMNQQKEVLDKFSNTGLAIYLKLAFEQAKKWNSYTTDYNLQSDIKGIIDGFFKLLENEHSEEFVRNAICYLLCGRYQGLAENEILEILAFDEEFWNKFLKNTHPDHRRELIDLKEDLEKNNKMMKIPIVVWSRLFLDLEPFLTERDADGIPIITFFHKQFNEVLRERYKLSDNLCEK